MNILRSFAFLLLASLMVLLCSCQSQSVQSNIIFENPTFKISEIPSTQTNSDLLISNLHTDIDPSSVGLIEGTLKNNSQKTYRYIEVIFNLYDAEGNQLETTIANGKNLESNGTWNFKAYVYDTTNTKQYKVVKVKGETE